MSDIKQDKLNQLAEDTALMDAIKFVFNKHIELEKPVVDKVNCNEIIGEKYRAYEKAKEILNKTFIEIESCKETRNNPKSFNKSI